MSTKEALSFLIGHLESRGSIKLLNESHWSLLKKYKNYLGFTCRDFYNKEHDKKMLLIERKSENGDPSDFDVIPDEDFLYFIKNESGGKPLYCYAPFLSNKGLTFKFALSAQLEQGIVSLGIDTVNQKLFSKLYEIFIKDLPKDHATGLERKVTFLPEDEMFFITSYNTNEIIETLELNKFKFNEKIFEYYQNGFYDKLYPDLLEVKYQFPEDVGKNSEETMNTVFFVVSKKDLNEENFTRIRKLLRKLSLDDLRVARKVCMDLNLKDSAKIKDLFQMEIKRRKVHNFVFN